MAAATHLPPRRRGDDRNWHLGISLKNLIVAPAAIIATFFVAVQIGQDGIKIEGWGALFVAGVILTLVGIVVAWRLAHHDYNVWAVVVSAVSAAILTLTCVLAIPEIDWAKSAMLLLLVAGLVIITAILAITVSTRD